MRQLGEHAISIKNLSKSFKDLLVLDGIDLSVKRGSVLALLGPNGAGKTTTIRILSTLLPADGGEVLVNGFDVRNEADKVRRSIGLTGQYAAIDEYLTGYENLHMMGKLYGLANADAGRRSRELLIQFDLEDAGDRSAQKYSGGMRRRLDLAASLIASPPIIFLDEPTTGLDPKARLAMWDVVKRLVGGGTTILLTTQQLEEADVLADRIAVLDCGKIIAEGTADELKREVGSERLEIVLAERNDFETARQSIRDESLQADERTRTLSIATNRGVDELKDVLRLLEGAGAQVESLSLHRPTLDDVFLSLTGHQATTQAEGDGQAPQERTQKEAPDIALVREEASAAAHTFEPRSKLVGALSNSWVLVVRSIKHITKNLDQLLSILISPIMFLLLFRYVFGGAIETGATSYVNFLVAGILVQMAAFGASTTAVNVAMDLKRGIVDRFRSLPMFSAALLIGHVTADLARNVISTIILLLVALLIGFNPNASLLDWLLMFGLLLVFTFAISWLSAILGLLANSVEAVQWLSFLVIFPLTFASSAFVPTESMPTAVRIFAENQPVTHVINAMRGWLVGAPVGNHGWIALVWFLAITVISIPIAARLFRRYKSQ